MLVTCPSHTRRTPRTSHTRRISVAYPSRTRRVRVSHRNRNPEHPSNPTHDPNSNPGEHRTSILTHGANPNSKPLQLNRFLYVRSPVAHAALNTRERRAARPDPGTHNRLTAGTPRHRGSFHFETVETPISTATACARVHPGRGDA